MVDGVVTAVVAVIFINVNCGLSDFSISESRHSKTTSDLRTDRRTMVENRKKKTDKIAI